MKIENIINSSYGICSLRNDHEHQLLRTKYLEIGGEIGGEKGIQYETCVNKTFLFLQKKLSNSQTVLLMPVHIMGDKNLSLEFQSNEFHKNLITKHFSMMSNLS